MDMKAEYEYRSNNLVRIGSILSPTKIIVFSNKTCHMPGIEYIVDENNLSYYVVNFHDYKVVKY